MHLSTNKSFKDIVNSEKDCPLILVKFYDFLLILILESLIFCFFFTLDKKITFKNTVLINYTQTEYLEVIILFFSFVINYVCKENI